MANFPVRNVIRTSFGAAENFPGHIGIAPLAGSIVSIIFELAMGRTTKRLDSLVISDFALRNAGVGASDAPNYRIIGRVAVLVLSNKMDTSQLFDPYFKNANAPGDPVTDLELFGSALKFDSYQTAPGSVSYPNLGIEAGENEVLYVIATPTYQNDGATIVDCNYTLDKRRLAVVGKTYSPDSGGDSLGPGRWV